MLRQIFAWVISFAVWFVPSAVLADQVQIQLVGKVPAVFEADLIWEETDTANCATPCRVESKRIKINRASNGMGLYNVDLIPPATRLCLNGMASDVFIRDSVLIKKSGRKFITDRKSRNIEANGRSGCSEPSTTLDDAIIWKVNLE